MNFRPVRLRSAILLSGLVLIAGLQLPRAEAADSPAATFSISGATIPQPPSDIKVVEGPKKDVPGFSADKDTAVSGVLDQKISSQGSVMLWFHTDAYHESGTAAPEFQLQPLVEIPGLFGISFVVEQQSIDLYIGWGTSRLVKSQGHVTVRRAVAWSDQVIRVFLPSLPGPGWHHLAVGWDATTGEINAWLDGTPYNVPGSKVKPWQAKEGTNVVVHVSPVAVAGVRVTPDPHITASLPDVVGKDYWGKLDSVLGAASRGTFDAAAHEGKLLYSTPLADQKDVEGWKMEGVGQVSFTDGWMDMKSANPNDGLNGGFVYWLPGIYPDKFLLSFEFKILNEYGLNIIFFAANGPDGKDVFDPSLLHRDGHFIQYYNGDLNNYHISYFANMPNEPRRTSNLRKNGGFLLMANGPVAFGKGGDGRIHTGTLMKDGPHIVMAVDGITLIDFIDDGKRAGQAWGSGRIAFRQMSWTDAVYRNLKVYEVK